MGSIYTVSQANSYIKNMFLQDFLLNDISVKGEVSNCKYHSSGHIYFSLKDKSGVLACVMFSSKRKGLKTHMQEGDKVVVTGNINVYERDGKYQLYANKIEQIGSGDLYQKYLKLKQELEDMGMFAQEYKKEIPEYAMTLGVVTAQTGAAVQDIINISKRRNPYIKIILYPAKVQGIGAAKSIVNGIKTLDYMKPDVIIIGRGGGSIEDLWAFNEEIVARAIFECETPIISAVGHETDFTIADFVADMRAPTPSAGAELAVFEYSKFESEILSYKAAFEYRLKNKINIYRNLVAQAKWKLDKMSPVNSIQSKRQYVADLEFKLFEIINKKTKLQRHRLELMSERLNGLSPLNKLSRGYAYVEDERKKPLTSIQQLKMGDSVVIHIKDGIAKSEIKEIFVNNNLGKNK